MYEHLKCIQITRTQIYYFVCIYDYINKTGN